MIVSPARAILVNRSGCGFLSSGNCIMDTFRQQQEEIVSRLDPSGSATLGRLYTCPCCGFLMLAARGQGEICDLCNWEDDGLDDPDAQSPSRANSPYTLQQAREAFRRYGVMYPPEDDPRIGGPDTPAETAAKQRIVAHLETLPGLESLKQLRETFGQVQDALEILDEQLKAKVARYEARELRRRNRME
jgi:hypothetical protein